MKARRLTSALFALLGAFPLTLIPFSGTHAAPVKTVIAFKAAYTGTIGVSRSFFATRKGKATVTGLGTSTLSARDSAIYLPERNAAVGVTTGQGSGTFKFGKKGNLKFLYMFSGDPVADGYFIIYGGTGKFARASGRGTFHEEGSAGPGQTAPVSDTFDGMLMFAK